MLAVEIAELLRSELARLVPTVQPALLSVKEAAVYLSRSEQAVQYLIFQRDLPARNMRRADMAKVGTVLGAKEDTHDFSGSTGNAFAHGDPWQIIEDRSRTPQGTGLAHYHDFSGKTSAAAIFRRA